jgi:hypothetical protein
MKTRKISPWGAGVFTAIASLLIAGALLFSKTLEPTAPPSTPISSSDPQGGVSSPPPASPAQPVQPETRVTPISIEGQSIEVELQLFNQPSLAFTTYVPTKEFQTHIETSDEGLGARFYYSPTGKKDENAYLYLYQPSSDNNSLEAVRQLILGDQGVMASNQWELGDRTDIVSYPWAKEKLTYQQQTPNGLAVGAIYIGENQGKAFYVLTHYPAEYTDGFEPRSAVILENLKFRE